MPTPPLLIREIDRLCREAGWTSTALAKRLDVNRTMLAHLRAGRSRLSSDLLGRILGVFPTPHVREYVLHYLEVELPKTRATHLAIPEATPPITDLPTTAQEALRAFVLHFASRALDGRGLFITGDATMIARAAAFIHAALTEHGIACARLQANVKTVTASIAEEALAVPLLLVERVDHLSAAVAELLLRRSTVVKPIVVTSTKDIEDTTDVYLRRVFTSMTKCVAVTPVHEASPPLHAAA